MHPQPSNAYFSGYSWSLLNKHMISDFKLIIHKKSRRIRLYTLESICWVASLVTSNPVRCNLICTWRHPTDHAKLHTRDLSSGQPLCFVHLTGKCFKELENDYLHQDQPSSHFLESYISVVMVNVAWWICGFYLSLVLSPTMFQPTYSSDSSLSKDQCPSQFL